MNQLVALLTLVERELSRIFRIWRQTIVPPVMTAALYILIFGYSLGSRIDLGTGVDYLTFIFPGLVIMGVITSSYSQSSFSLFINKFHRSIQELLASPMSYLSINAGYTLGGIVRSSLVGVSTYLVGFLLAGVTIAYPLLALYIVLITGIIFAQFGIITAMWAQDFDQVNVFVVFLITPLIYLGGVFYSVEMLPPFWRSISQFNPIFYLVDSFRFAFIGSSDTNVFLSVAVATLIAIVLVSAAMYLMRKGYKIKS